MNQAYFHQIMSDLPAKYQTTNDSSSVVSPEQVPNTKIRLKLPTQHTTTRASIEPEEPQATNNASVRLRVPPLTNLGTNTRSDSSAAVATVDTAATTTPSKQTRTSPTTQPTALPTSIPQTSQVPVPNAPPITPARSTSSPTPAIAAPTPKPAVTTPAQISKPSTPSIPVTGSQLLSQPLQPTSINPTPFTQSNATSHVAPQNFYNSTLQPSRASTRASGTPAPVSTPTLPTASASRSDAPSPAPPASAAGLFSLCLDLCPSKSKAPRTRLAVLNSRAGVRVWVLRVPTVKLVDSEVSVIVRDVKLVPREDDGDGSEEEAGKAEPAPIPKKRGRGRPRKVQHVQSSQQEVEAAPVEEREKDRDKEKKERPLWRAATASEVTVQLDGKPVTVSSSPIPSPLLRDTPELPLLDQNIQVKDEPEIVPKDAAEWVVGLKSGQHTLEVGRKGSTVTWQVYLIVP